MAVAGVVQFLREQVVRAELETVTDAQLLQRFIAERDEAAFAALVRRHAAMVWGVCKRVLGHDQNAEDAFQATFMVLVRKAASIRPQSLLGNWLYGVANQVAVKARAMNAKRMSREKQLPVPIANAAAKQDAWQELQPLLDQELALLPEKYRVIIVMCDLEGRTRKEAAQCLGVPEGTVAGRQARARAILAKRLARHGFAVAGGSLVALLSQAAASAAPASTVASTIKSANVLAAGGSVLANVAALTEGVVKAMFLTKLKSTCGILIVILGLGLSTVALSGAFPQGDAKKRDAAAGASDAQLPKDKGDAQVPKKFAPAPKTDEEKLQGVWKLVRMESGGMVVSEKEIAPPFPELIFQKNRIETDKRKRPAPFQVGTFTLDATTKPKKIAIVTEFSGPKFPSKGIYALDGDDLKICIQFNAVGTRNYEEATEFKTNAGSWIDLYSFKREPAKADPPKAPAAPAVPPQADGKVGHIKVEARGRVIAKKNKDGSTPYFLRVEQNKPAPAVEWLIRTKFDNATVIRHVLDLKDTEVILTGNLAWLPKGALTDTDDDYALGFVIQEKAQLERLDPKDKSPHYLKLEAARRPGD
jgi:RNA polymerase sigma factor (sigma-70 family)